MKSGIQLLLFLTLVMLPSACIPGPTPTASLSPTPARGVNTPTIAATQTPAASVTPSPSATSAASATATETATPRPPTPTKTVTVPPSPTPSPTTYWPDPSAQCQAMTTAGCADVRARDNIAPVYQITATIQLEPTTLISGTQRVYYRNREKVPLNAIYFRLYANASTYGGTLTVSDVEVNDQPVPTRILESDTVLALALPQPLPPDNVAVIDMGFRTLVPRDSQVHYQIFNYEKGIGAFSNFYPTLAVYDQQGWDIDPILTQGDSTYCAISFYEVNLTAPSDTKLVTSGTQIDHASNGDGTAMWRFVTGPIRDFGLAVSTAYEMAEQELGPIRVRSFYLPQDQAGGKKLLEHARDALEAYQQQLGPYPYNEFDVAEAPIGAGGMELPGMTLIQIDHYDRTDGYDEFVVAHEVAHQWWYNLVGNDQQEAPWIDEGLTNYCAVIYYEETYQQQEGEQWLTWYLRDPYNRAVDAGLDKPAVLPVSAYDGVVYYRIVYAKAGLFYHALRQRLGDAQFFRLLGEYLEIYKYDRVTTDEVLDFWRQRANQDISDLIERWLLTPRS